MKSSRLSSRAIAVSILEEVCDRGLSFDDSLNAALSDGSMAQRDRGFVRRLTATTLRRLGQIDGLIDACLDSPLTARAHGARRLMQIGCAQLLFLDVPGHAAIGETVELARGPKLAPYRKLINAVLRRLQREGTAHLEQQDAARLNTPEWLWASWSLAYGEETCRAIADAHMMTPPLDLTVKSDAADWAGRLEGILLPTQSIRLRPSGPITKLPGFEAGEWWVQDAAAALPARLLGDVRDQRVADLCAAPGGKTAQLATSGARVIALDRSKNRLKRLSENMERLKLSVDTVLADAAEWRPDAPLDAVLLDAPCSATGTLRRHPDVALHKTPEDVAKLTAAQDRLLLAALDMVKPGGRIVFCTCSLQSEEGPDRIEALLARGAAVDRDPVQAGEIGGLAEGITPDGDLRTLPCHMAGDGGMDGFYACRLRKR